MSYKINEHSWTKTLLLLAAISWIRVIIWNQLNAQKGTP